MPRIPAPLAALAILSAAYGMPAIAQLPPSGQAAFTYADLTDLAAGSPIVADVTVLGATRLKREQAVGVLPGYVRYYINGQVLALVRGAKGLPGTVSWLVDLPLDSGGRVPKLAKKTHLLLFARPGGREGELQLSAPDAQFAWSADLDSRVRAILTGLTAADAPPEIIGFGSAFHVLGSLPGESETQIFLKTPDNRPISLNILRRPGQDPRWAVALGEMVDEAAAPPAPETLLWYRLACFLPATLPDSATAELAPPDAAAAQADYRVVTSALGGCARNHSRR